MLYPPCTQEDLSLFKKIFPYLLFLLYPVEMLPPFIIFCNSRQELTSLLEPSFWFVNVPIVELVSCTRFIHFGPQTRLCTALSFCLHILSICCVAWLDTHWMFKFEYIKENNLRCMFSMFRKSQKSIKAIT